MKKTALQIRRSIICLIALGLFFFLINGQKSQAVTIGEINSLLMTELLFSKDDISKLYNGELITKLLPVKDKREVSVCGVVAINASPEVGFQAFQETMLRQNKKSVIESGSFSDAPIIDDIRTLTIDDNEIEEIKRCRIGDCKIKLSAPMIERFQREIDWNSANYREQVKQLFRQQILDYVKNFLSNGDNALIEYRDQPKAVRLQEEHKSLLNGLFGIDEFAPEFSKYLKDSPASEHPNVKKSIDWVRFKFGFEPVIAITQTLTYTGENREDFQILSVSKQLYASHYLDSSLGLTALVKSSSADSNQNTYLLYSNTTRSPSLGGVLGKLKREIVEQESLSTLNTLLRGTKSFAERKSLSNDENPENSAGFWSIFESENSKMAVIFASIIAVVFFIGVGFMRRNHQ